MALYNPAWLRPDCFGKSWEQTAMCMSCGHLDDCAEVYNAAYAEVYNAAYGAKAAETRPPHEAGANARQVAGTHYKDMGVEPWAVVDTWPLEQRIGAYRHGALKYLMRMGTKDEQLQEIKKAAHYLEKLIEVLSDAGPR